MERNLLWQVGATQCAIMIAGLQGKSMCIYVSERRQKDLIFGITNFCSLVERGRKLCCGYFLGGIQPWHVELQFVLL